MSPEQPNVRPSANFGDPGDNDGRQRGDWETRYPKAQRAFAKIRLESWILTCYFIGHVVLSIWFWHPNSLLFLKLTAEQVHALQEVGFMALGGLLGGTTYAMKWLYHSCAKNIWNEDRFIWRVYAPLVSAAISVALLLLCRAGVVSVFNPDFSKSLSACYSIGFLVGYFSDNAVGKLSEIALTLFGSRKPTSNTSGSNEKKLENGK